MAISTSSQRGGVTSDINVTPMIDVMLVLLIIFMIVTPLIAAGFQATMPKGTSANLEKDPEKASCKFGDGQVPDPECEVILGIDQRGNLFLQGTPVCRPQETGCDEKTKLQETLTTIYNARTEDKVLYLKAHNQIRYGRIQDAVELARASGVRVLAAVTEPAKSGLFDDLAAE